MRNSKVIIKTGTADDFFVRLKDTARKLDNKEIIKPAHIITFEDPSDMISFLSPKKMELINAIKTNPLKTITELAETLHRNRSSVSKDINSMAEVGIVKVDKVNNPGHGVAKRVSLSFDKLVLQAAI